MPGQRGEQVGRGEPSPVQGGEPLVQLELTGVLERVDRGDAREANAIDQPDDGGHERLGQTVTFVRDVEDERAAIAARSTTRKRSTSLAS